jgi:hypothetical protein
VSVEENIDLHNQEIKLIIYVFVAKKIVEDLGINYNVNKFLYDKRISVQSLLVFKDLKKKKQGDFCILKFLVVISMNN